MPLRAPELKEAPPPAPLPSRLSRLKDLISSGDWSDEDDLDLIYWSPKEGGRWIAWKDAPAPAKDPLVEAGVGVGP